MIVPPNRQLGGMTVFHYERPTAPIQQPPDQDVYPVCAALLPGTEYRVRPAAGRHRPLPDRRPGALVHPGGGRRLSRGPVSQHTGDAGHLAQGWAVCGLLRGHGSGQAVHPRPDEPGHHLPAHGEELPPARAGGRASRRTSKARTRSRSPPHPSPEWPRNPISAPTAPAFSKPSRRSSPPGSPRSNTPSVFTGGIRTAGTSSPGRRAGRLSGAASATGPSSEASGWPRHPSVPCPSRPGAFWPWCSPCWSVCAPFNPSGWSENTGANH